MLHFFYISIIFLMFSMSLVASDSWSGQGEVTLELRQFENDDNGLSIDTGIAVLSRVESKFEEDHAKHIFRGFARVDQKDADRGFVAIEDAYFSYLLGEEENSKILIGYKTYNWSATEAFHPADVINSRNFDSDIENLEKKGELVIEWEYLLNDGSIAFLFLPRFENPEFPDAGSRLGFGKKIDRATFVSNNEVKTDRWAKQYGVALSSILFDTDITGHILKHIDRNRPFIGSHQFVKVANTVIPTGSVLRPYYFETLQVGGTLEKTVGGTIIKMEGAYRNISDGIPIAVLAGYNNGTPVFSLTTPESHTEIAIGIENLYTYDDSGQETNIFFELTSTFGLSKDQRAQQSIFQRDMMVGLRHALNDEMGTEIFTSFIFDLERKNEYLFNLSFQRRLSDDWKVKSGVRVYYAPIKKELAVGLEALNQSDHVFFNLSRYF